MTRAADLHAALSDPAVAQAIAAAGYNAAALLDAVTPSKRSPPPRETHPPAEPPAATPSLYYVKSEIRFASLRDFLRD